MGLTTVDMSPLVNKADFDFKFDLSWYKFNTNVPGQSLVSI